MASIQRLTRTAGFYLAGGVLQKLASLALLPLYTRILTRGEFGAVEVLLQSVLGAGFLLRFGLIEAVLRFYHRDVSSPEQQWRVINVAFTFLCAAATAGSLAVGLAAAPVSRFLLAETNVTLIWIAAFGLWIQCLAELVLAIVRLQERSSLFLALSVLNLVASIGATLALLVGLRLGAAALLAGNFIGNAVMIAAIMVIYRHHLRLAIHQRTLAAMLRFGVPAMPAEVSVFLLSVVDRIALVRISGLAEAGIYSLGLKLSQVALFLVQAYYQAWPPYAYSIADDDEARRTYGFVTSSMLLILVWLAASAGLLAPWVISLMAGPRYAAASATVPLVCLAGALNCVYLSLMVALGRLGLTKLNFPLTVVGTGVNIGLNLLLIPHYGATGAAIAFAGGYLAMLPGIAWVVRRRFPLTIDTARVGTALLVCVAVFALGVQTPSTGALPLVVRGMLAAGCGLGLVLTLRAGARAVGMRFGSAQMVGI